MRAIPCCCESHLQQVQRFFYFQKKASFFDQKILFQNRIYCWGDNSKKQCPNSFDYSSTAYAKEVVPQNTFSDAKNTSVQIVAGNSYFFIFLPNLLILKESNPKFFPGTWIHNRGLPHNCLCKFSPKWHEVLCIWWWHLQTNKFLPKRNGFECR